MHLGRSGSSRSQISPSFVIWSSTSTTSWRSCHESSRGSSVDDVTVIDGEYLQTPEELEEYKQFSNCINCMLCYAACPIYGLEPDFIGPAAIALAERYDLDSRDRGQRERLDILIEKEGVWGCTFVGDRTRVCPKHVDPAGAIQRYKLKAAKENVKAFLLPRGAR